MNKFSLTTIFKVVQIFVPDIAKSHLTCCRKIATNFEKQSVKRITTVNDTMRKLQQKGRSFVTTMDSTIVAEDETANWTLSPCENYIVDTVFDITDKSNPGLPNPMVAKPVAKPGWKLISQISSMSPSNKYWRDRKRDSIAPMEPIPE